MSIVRRKHDRKLETSTNKQNGAAVAKSKILSVQKHCIHTVVRA